MKKVSILHQFKELSQKPVSQREEAVANYWDEIDLLDKSVSTRSSNKPFIFMKDHLPPTADLAFTMSFRAPLGLGMPL